MNVYLKTTSIFPMGDQPCEDLLIIISMKDDDPQEGEAAFNEFCKRFGSYVWNAAYNRCKGTFFAEEDFPKVITNNTLYTVFEKADLYDPSKNKGSSGEMRIKGWLGGIIKNQYFDLIRKHENDRDNRKNYLSVVSSKNQDFVHPENETEEVSKILPIKEECFYKVLSSLDERKKEVLLTYMRFKDGRKQLPEGELQRLAELYKTTPENLRQIKHRAMKEVKQLTEKCEEKSR